MPTRPAGSRPRTGCRQRNLRRPTTGRSSRPVRGHPRRGEWPYPGQPLPIPPCQRRYQKRRNTSSELVRRQGFEPRTRGLRALSHLPAQTAIPNAQNALDELGVREYSFHDPFHGYHWITRRRRHPCSLRDRFSRDFPSACVGRGSGRTWRPRRGQWPGASPGPVLARVGWSAWLPARLARRRWRATAGSLGAQSR